jgi:hypothetical protein
VPTVKPKIENKERPATMPPKKAKPKPTKEEMRARALKGAETKRRKKAQAEQAQDDEMNNSQPVSSPQGAPSAAPKEVAQPERSSQAAPSTAPKEVAQPERSSQSAPSAAPEEVAQPERSSEAAPPAAPEEVAQPERSSEAAPPAAPKRVDKLVFPDEYLQLAQDPCHIPELPGLMEYPETLDEATRSKLAEKGQRCLDYNMPMNYNFLPLHEVVGADKKDFCLSWWDTKQPGLLKFIDLEPRAPGKKEAPAQEHFIGKKFPQVTLFYLLNGEKLNAGDLAEVLGMRKVKYVYMHLTCLGKSRRGEDRDLRAAVGTKGCELLPTRYVFPSTALEVNPLQDLRDSWHHLVPTVFPCQVRTLWCQLSCALGTEWCETDSVWSDSHPLVPTCFPCPICYILCDQIPDGWGHIGITVEYL